MKPIIRTYEIEAWPPKEGRIYTELTISIDKNNHFFFSDMDNVAFKDKPMMVAWLRKAADALEKAELE